MLLGYTRVSTLEQAREDRSSLQEQERVIRGMAMAMGIGQFELQIYEDAGVSASKMLCHRPAGRHLYDDAKKGDIVVASKLDRMFRDALDAQYTYKNFKEREIDLILYDMGNESVTRDGMAKCFFTVLSAFADLERTRIADRMREGKEAKRAKGGWTGGKAPYGYRIIGSGREAMLEVVPEEQKIVAAVHSMAGKPSRWIAMKLEQQGFLTRKGTKFRDIQVKRILESQHAIVQA